MKRPPNFLFFASSWSVGCRLLCLGGILFVVGPLLEFWCIFFPRGYQKGWRWICGLVVHSVGLKIKVYGQKAQGPTLFVSNHASYLDIPILWHLLPASFVSKAEVQSWPFIGWFAQRQGALFVSRKNHRTGKELIAFQKALATERNFILFPEGTSSDGTFVYPFKSTFFQMAKESPTVIQPVSLVYHSLCGRPMGRFFRKLYGWYGDLALTPHLLQLLYLGPVSVSVIFHPPLDSKEFTSRKALAVAAHESVSGGLRKSFFGDFPEP